MSDQNRMMGSNTENDQGPEQRRGASPAQHLPFRPINHEDKASGELSKTTSPAVTSFVEELKPVTEPIESRQITQQILADLTENKNSNITKKSKSRADEMQFSSERIPDIVEVKSTNIKKRIDRPYTQTIESELALTEDNDEQNDTKNSKSVENIEIKTFEPAVEELDRLSDDNESIGPPRSESRTSRTSQGSRMFRAARQLICCGMPYEAASEDELDNLRGGTGI